MKFFSISSSSTISGVLRRIFCFKTSLPTPNHMHENITEFRNFTDENIGSNSNPGIVARLMGLDSMPLMDLTNIPIEKASNSISKEGVSESLEENLVPYPVFILKHEEDYIVISFEDGKKENGSKARRRRRRKRKRRSRSFDGKFEEIHTNEEEEKGKENQDPHKDGKFKEVCECYSKFSTEKRWIFSGKTNCENPSNGEQQSKATYSSKREEVEEQHSDSEHYSPSSVLDVDTFYTDLGVVAKSEGGGLVLGSLNSRRKLPMELGNYKEQFPFINNATLGEIREMARKDVTKSSWIGIQMWQLEDNTDMVSECEAQIMGRLLDELVDQLIDVSLT